MEVLHPRCAGLDIHAAIVVACVRIASGRTVTYDHRTVSTTTRGLLELADWLTAHGVTHVAMEGPASTGSRCGMCSRSTSRSSSPTRCTSGTSRDARAIRTTRRGSPICWRWG